MTKLDKVTTNKNYLLKLKIDLINRALKKRSVKFKDGAVYRVKLERSFGKATLD